MSNGALDGLTVSEACVYLTRSARSPDVQHDERRNPMATKFTISADDIVVIIFALLGFGGCIVFAQWGSVHPLLCLFSLPPE